MISLGDLPTDELVHRELHRELHRDIFRHDPQHKVQCGRRARNAERGRYMEASTTTVACVARASSRVG